MSSEWLWASGGWDYNTWKARDAWQVLYSQQSGESESLRLAMRRELRTGWEAHSLLWQFLTDQILGRLTDAPPQSPDCETLETRKLSGHRARLVRYRVTEREWVRAWLLEPAGEARPRPGVVLAHPAMADGKEALAGFAADAGMAWGCELVARGFVALIPDAVGFGERQPGRADAAYSSAADFFSAHPEGSAAAKMAFDLSRAVDVLSCMPSVDPNRIGALGHGMGAAALLFATAQDRRIGASVVNCGFNLLRSDPSPSRWWRASCLLPRLGYYERYIDQTPIDFHHWLGLTAPRPLLVSASMQDDEFPGAEAIRGAVRLAKDVYRLYNVPENVRTYCFAGPHGFPRSARLTAYRFLESEL